MLLYKNHESKAIQCNKIYEILSANNIKDLALSMGSCIRTRKFNLAAFISTIASHMSLQKKSNSFTLIQSYDIYNKNMGDNTMSYRCIYNQISKEKSVDVVYELLVNTMNMISKQYMDLLKKKDNNLLSMLLKMLNVKDIIIIDGTEIQTRESTTSFLGNNHKGRNKLDGTQAKPSIKAHIAISYVTQSIVNLSFTEGVASERDQVCLDNIKDCLIIADRGYISENLFNKLEESNNYFLIRARANSTGSIISAIVDGKEDPKLKDTSVNKFIARKSLADFKIKTKNNNELRLIQAPVPTSSKDNKNNYCRFYTNMPQDIINAANVARLYRLRWTIEIFNKALKQGCNFESINSSNKNIVLFFLMLSILTALHKIAVANIAKIRLGMFFISTLKLFCLDEFEKLFKAYTKGKSTVYKVINKLVNIIKDKCVKSKPSRRDELLLKDQELLIKIIISSQNNTCNNSI